MSSSGSIDSSDVLFSWKSWSAGLGRMGQYSYSLSRAVVAVRRRSLVAAG